MGVGPITPRREVSHGEMNYATQRNTPNVASAVSGGGKDGGGGRPSLRGLLDPLASIGAMLRAREDKEADQIAADIRDYSDKVLKDGYYDQDADDTRPGILTRQGDDIIGSAALHDRLVEEYAQQRLEGASDTIKARVAQVTQQLRHATFTNLKKWETTTYAANQVKDIEQAEEADTASYVERQRLRGTLVPPDADADLVRADMDEGFNDLLGRTRMRREKIADDLMRRGMLDERAARAKADAICRNEAARVVAALAQNGDFARARHYTALGEQIGFTGEQVTEAQKQIDAEEQRQMREAEFAVQRAAKQVQKDFSASLAQLYDPKQEVSEDEMPFRYAELCERAGAAARGVGDMAGAARFFKEAIDTRQAADRAAERAAVQQSAEEERLRQAADRAAERAAVQQSAEEERLRKSELAANETELRYAEAALDMAEESGALPPEALADMHRRIYQKASRLIAARDLTPEAFAAFRSRWAARTNAETRAAAVEFDRAFGLTFGLDGDGDVAAADRSRALKANERVPFLEEGYNLGTPGYFKMRDAYLARLRTLPNDVSRKEATARLIGEFRQDWFQKAAQANIKKLVPALMETMTGVQQRMTADQVASDRREAEAERRRTMPLVDREHPANRGDDEDWKREPLSFYRLPGMD